MLKGVVVITIIFCNLDLTESRYTRRYYSWYEGSFKCNNNELYKENYCNYCTCHNNRLLNCTAMVCTGEDYYTAKYCKVGAKWKKDCNNCECVEKYGTVCTIHECPDTGRPDESSDENICKCEPCMPCKCPCDKNEPDEDENELPRPTEAPADSLEPDEVDNSNPDCTYPPENYDYYGDKGDSPHPETSTTCRPCPVCAPCDCSHCDGKPDGSNEECTYPPDDYDYYGDGGGDGGGGGGDGGERPHPDPEPDEPGNKDNPECTYPPDNYDYYGDKRW